ncbi:MAG TPA: phage holin family protein [Candidatus Saccharibacteria bacterium]|nr:phage holin family protein [Candidatus Saccharibacteria bacterium]
MKKNASIFIIRWVLNSLGLWVAVQLFGTGSNNFEVTVGVFGFLFAGLVFSIINAIIKPFLVILSLPAILVSLGLFMIVVNGFMVYISLLMAPGITMTFGNSILAGIVLSLVNYIVSATSALKSD